MSRPLSINGRGIKIIFMKMNFTKNKAKDAQSRLCASCVSLFVRGNCRVSSEQAASSLPPPFRLAVRLSICVNLET